MKLYQPNQPLLLILTINVHLRKVNERQYRLFKSAAAKRSVSLSKHFEEAIGAWASGSEEISEEQVMNDLTYRRMKKRLEREFSGKYIIIAGGKFLGAEDFLENAWVLATAYENALVTRMIKKPQRVKLFGSSLRLAASENV